MKMETIKTELKNINDELLKLYNTPGMALQFQPSNLKILKKQIEKLITLEEALNMKLIVEIKNVYGVPRVYPVCAKSHSFARIAGLKTLSPEVIEEIKKMGYKLTEEKKEI
jgi:hypothetical protein